MDLVGNIFAKNSQDQIFVTGRNDCGQLGTGDTQSLSCCLLYNISFLKKELQLINYN